MDERRIRPQHQVALALSLAAVTCLAAARGEGGPGTSQKAAQAILKETGVQGGFIISGSGRDQ